MFVPRKVTLTLSRERLHQSRRYVLAVFEREVAKVVFIFGLFKLSCFQFTLGIVLGPLGTAFSHKDAVLCVKICETRADLIEQVVFIKIVYFNPRRFVKCF